MLKTVAIFLLLSPVAFAVNKTVKAGGGGDFTTIQACATAMAAGDTCTVFAGTYSESPSIPAGSVGLYKTIQINGTDVVNVTGGFTLNSHTKVSGFVMNHTGSCISLGATATDVIIGPNNNLTSCGTVGINIGNSFIYVQGNTFAYAGCIPPNPVASCGRWIGADASNLLIENNDISHYQLAIVIGSNTGAVSNIIIRNNTFHDQIESEANLQNGGPGHTDSIFSEPANGVANVLAEGNRQNNAVGSNAKGFLTQNDSGCTTSCTQWITRFNIINRTGSGAMTNDKSWPFVKLYNNTLVDEGQEAAFVSPGGGGDNMLSTGGGMSAINNIWYIGTQTTSAFNNWNPVFCNGCTVFGHSLYFCAVGTSCTSVFNHVYQGGAFLTDTGNKNANPQFVSYAGVGSASSDFHLQAGSPAIAAGTNLTTVAAGDSGSGTSLVVNDARFFQDGYGLINSNSTVQADCVAVGTVSNTVCITAVNYSTNTLTLAGSISRSNGQSVWLYKKSDGVQVLTGAAPDMGALPFNGGPGPASPSTCSPGTTVNSISPINTVCTNPNSGTTVQCYRTDGGTPATNGLGTGCTAGAVLANGGTVFFMQAGTLKIIAGTSVGADSTVSSYTYSFIAPPNVSATIMANVTSTGQVVIQ